MHEEKQGMELKSNRFASLFSAVWGILEYTLHHWDGEKCAASQARRKLAINAFKFLIHNDYFSSVDAEIGSNIIITRVLL